MNVIAFDVFAAVNDAIALWPGRIDYAATLHPDKLAGWMKRRAEAGYPGMPQRWTYQRGEPAKTEMRADRVTRDWGGGSGLFTAKVLRECGLTRIVLAGIPMDDRPHVAGSTVKHPAAPWTACKDFRKAWREHRTEIAPFVRSMSGWTRDLFGAPTAEWLSATP